LKFLLVGRSGFFAYQAGIVNYFFECQQYLVRLYGLDEIIADLLLSLFLYQFKKKDFLPSQFLAFI